MTVGDAEVKDRKRARVVYIERMLESSVMNRAEKKKIVLERSTSPARSKKPSESLHKIVKTPAYRFSVCAQYVKCGKPNCKCALGQSHGPYFAAFWKQNGRIRKRYIKLADVEQMREFSEQPRLLLREIAENNAMIRQLKALVREHEELVRRLARG
jgi:hypothetical protein